MDPTSLDLPSDPTTIPPSAFEPTVADPVVVVVLWILVCAYRLKAPHAMHYPKVFPTVAILLAIGLRAAASAIQGEPLTAETLFRGAFAGMLAMLLGHMQSPKLETGSSTGPSPTSMENSE